MEALQARVENQISSHPSQIVVFEEKLDMIEAAVKDRDRPGEKGIGN
jgi:hypothetical protein